MYPEFVAFLRKTMRVNGEMYAEFLENQLPGLLEDVPLNLRQRLIFQQDGAYFL